MPFQDQYMLSVPGPRTLTIWKRRNYDCTYRVFAMMKSVLWSSASSENIAQKAGLSFAEMISFFLPGFLEELRKTGRNR